MNLKLLLYHYKKMIKNTNVRDFDDFEIDDELEEFLKFIKDKENEKIPEPTPFTISTQSAWCTINDLHDINLSKVVSYIAKNILDHLLFKKDEYFIQGLVIENMVLRFDDIYHKKYKKNYIKFFGNVIETNNYEDCLLMYNNLYLLENNSLKKQGRQKNKKDNEHFYNSCSIIAKGGAGQKAVNIKLFNNGQITLTGAKKDTDGYNACVLLLSELKRTEGVFYKVIKKDSNDTKDSNEEIENVRIPCSKQEIDKAIIDNFRITMINSDFNTKFKINLMKFLDILNNTEKDRFIKFNPAIYRGLMIGYFWNKNKKIQDGCCTCEKKCTGKKKKNSKDKNEENYCKKITISIFKSGSVIITGGYLQQQIHDAYAFINGLFKKHFHQIIKLSILDFKKDDDSIETPVDQSINNLLIS